MSLCPWATNSATWFASSSVIVGYQQPTSYFYMGRIKRIWYLSPMRAAKVQASQKEPSDRKPDPWPLWMAGHVQLTFVRWNAGRHKFAWRATHVNWNMTYTYSIFNCPWSICSLNIQTPGKEDYNVRLVFLSSIVIQKVSGLVAWLDAHPTGIQEVTGSILQSGNIFL